MSKPKKSRSWLRPFGRKSSKSSEQDAPAAAAAASAAASAAAPKSCLKQDGEGSVASTSTLDNLSNHSSKSASRNSNAAASNEYGYEGADMSNYMKQKYGYGDAAPESKSNTKTNTNTNTNTDTNTDKYGYGDAAPDSAAAMDYGYGDPAPDKYGYGDAAPDPPRNESSPTLLTKTPRRSSMKQQGAPRRSSIGYSGEVVVDLPTRGRVKRRTSIGFKEEVDEKVVERIGNLTDTAHELWFQEEEYQRIRHKSYALVDKVSKTGTDKYCMRGLEKMLTPKETSVKKQQAWDAVLSEQYLQRNEGQVNEEHIANLYKFTSMRPSTEAAQRANRDAEEAENYLKQARRQYRRRCSM